MRCRSSAPTRRPIFWQGIRRCGGARTRTTQARQPRTPDPASARTSRTRPRARPARRSYTLRAAPARRGRVKTRLWRNDAAGTANPRRCPAEGNQGDQRSARIAGAEDDALPPKTNFVSHPLRVLPSLGINQTGIVFSTASAKHYTTARPPCSGTGNLRHYHGRRLSNCSSSACKRLSAA